jgi:hypothetical protein
LPLFAVPKAKGELSTQLMGTDGTEGLAIGNVQSRSS